MSVWLDHVHDFSQDALNEVYLKISEDGSTDSSQKWVSSILDVAMAVVADLEFPGAAITGFALQAIVGSFVDDTPDSLKKAFGDAWGRFGASYEAEEDMLSQFANDPVGNWDKTFTDAASGKTFTVSQLGSSDVFFPSRDPKMQGTPFYDPVKFSSAADSSVAAFKYNLTKNLIGKKWTILHSPKRTFWDGWNDSDARNFAKNQVNSNRDILVLWRPDEDGSCAGCPNHGMSTLEVRIGVGQWYSSWDYYHGENASKDMCDWLIKDDGYGTILNPDALATRKDVFYNWPLEGNLNDHPENYSGPTKERQPVSEESIRRARNWHKLFSEKPRAELEGEIVQEALDNPVFMANLVKDPKGTVEGFAGVQIPDEVKVEVIQERPGDYKLLIPYVGRKRKEPQVGSLLLRPLRLLIVLLCSIEERLDRSLHVFTKMMR
jgi:hypothetical protein